MFLEFLNRLPKILAGPVSVHGPSTGRGWTVPAQDRPDQGTASARASYEWEDPDLARYPREMVMADLVATIHERDDVDPSRLSRRIVSSLAWEFCHANEVRRPPWPRFWRELKRHSTIVRPAQPGRPRLYCLNPAPTAVVVSLRRDAAA